MTTSRYTRTIKVTVLKQGSGNYLKCWIHIWQLEAIPNSIGHFSKLKGMLKELGVRRCEYPQFIWDFLPIGGKKKRIDY